MRKSNLLKEFLNKFYNKEKEKTKIMFNNKVKLDKTHPKKKSSP